MERTSGLGTGFRSGSPVSMRASAQHHAFHQTVAQFLNVGGDAAQEDRPFLPGLCPEGRESGSR
jgi:hypothetical protein